MNYLSQSNFSENLEELAVSKFMLNGQSNFQTSQIWAKYLAGEGLIN